MFTLSPFHRILIHDSMIKSLK
uniref:Uncharacterized protein n=1 Tax=Arundo donax TaxID=35708 RepID=A0A0A8Y6A6_ARUDO